MIVAGAIVIDSRSVILVWGKSCTDIFGIPEEQALGRTLFETIMPDRYSLQHLRGVQHYIQTGEAPFIGSAVSAYGVFHAADGTTTEIPIMLAISIIPSGEGRDKDTFSAVILNRGG